jgi:ribonuclease HI
MERSGIYIVPPYEDSQSQSRRLTRRAALQPATIFTPQDASLVPEVHFPLQTVCAPDRPPYPRFVNRFDSREILLVIDGSCVDNGRHNRKYEAPVAGCAFSFKGTPSIDLEPGPTPVTFPFLGLKEQQEVMGSIAFRLEREGPYGEPIEHTSNRAKLRAVIAALQYRPWDAEGWRRVVILTDLKYIVRGTTTWLPRWVKRAWKKPRRRRGKYANRDIWEELQGRIDELRARGCEVSFWLVRGSDENESQFIARQGRSAEGGQVEPGDRGREVHKALWDYALMAFLRWRSRLVL